MDTLEETSQYTPLGPLANRHASIDTAPSGKLSVGKSYRTALSNLSADSAAPSALSVWAEAANKEYTSNRIDKRAKDVVGRSTVEQACDVDGKYYLIATFLLVVFNVVVIGYEAEFGTSLTSYYLCVSIDMVFLADLVIRLCVKRSLFFYDRAGDWKWNWFDLVIMASSLVQAYGEKSMALGDRGDFIKTMRLFRIVRVFRVLRMFREFSVIAEGFFKALQCVGWISGMMVFVIFMCSVITTQALGKHAGHHSAEIYEKFGTLSNSMYTHFEMLTLDGWSHTTQMVAHQCGVWWRLFFITYVVVVGFCLMALLTAVITDQTMNALNEDRAFKEKSRRLQNEALALEVRNIFNQIDSDGSGTLTKQELINVVYNPGLCEIFENMNFPHSEKELADLFDVIDADGSGGIQIDEFVESITKVQGEARAKELFALRVFVARKLLHLQNLFERNSSTSLGRNATLERAPNSATSLKSSSDPRLKLQTSPSPTPSPNGGSVDAALASGLQCVEALRSDKDKLHQLCSAALQALRD